MLVTLHMWPDAYPPALFASRPNLHLQCVSEAQRRACPRASRPLLIRNGVNLRELAPEGPKHGFILALGRICPEKGFHLAIDAAKAAGLPILIGGAVFPYAAHRRYFDAMIAPRLDDGVRYLGPLNRRTKRRLLAAARCLVVPSTVRETSSLAAMEALACGTAVVAVRTPALEELIDDGETGVLVESADRMDRALCGVDRISPARCRSAAEQRCSAEQMTAEYLACYEDIAARQRSMRRRSRAADLAVLSSVGDLESIRDEWIGLAEQCPASTVFQRPEWLIPWTRHLLRGALQCVTVRHGDALVGIVPLARTIADGQRALVLAGSGVSDYLGGLAAPDHGPLVVNRLRSLLVSDIRDWDRIDLHQLQRDDPLMQLEPGTATVAEADACPVLSRGATPHHMLANLRYYRRRAERRGEVTFEVATADSIDEFVPALFRLHAARWSGRGSPGVLADAAVQAFHTEAMPAMQRAGLLSLHALRIDRRIAAVAYCLRSGTRVWYYLGGFDPVFGEISPGTLVLGHAIECGWRDGATEFDFLRGREGYKYLWGAVDRPTFYCRLQNADCRLDSRLD
jgi:CelD/BcsL family acetyltransferase involved in cellulose biosynthesis